MGDDETEMWGTNACNKDKLAYQKHGFGMSQELV